MLKSIKWSVLIESERHQFVDFEFGDKPIFSFDLKWYGKDIFKSKYPFIDRKQTFKGKVYLSRYLYKPGQKKNVLRLIKLEQNFVRCKFGHKKWMDYARKIGKLYGYSKKDMEAFVRKNQKRE